MPPLDTAVDTLIAQGASDDEIRTVITGIRQQTDKYINEGRSDEEIESAISQSKWKDVPLFGAPKAAASVTQPANRPTRAEAMTPEQREQFRKRTEGEGLEEPSFLSELANPINLLTGGLNSLVSRGVGRVLGNTVMQRTPGVIREAIDWQTMGTSNLPAAAKKVYQGYKAAPKTMAEKATALEASGARMVPGTGQIAPNVTGQVEDVGRQIITPGKGTVGAYTDDLAAQLEQQDYIKQSPLGKLALAEDLKSGYGSVVDPEVQFNINNANLKHLEGQLNRTTEQYNTLTKSMRDMKEGSKGPAKNILDRIFKEKQTIADEITELRMQQNALIPQVARKNTAEKAAELADKEAINLQLREAEQTNILAREVLEPTVGKKLPTSDLPLDPSKMTLEQAAAQRAIDEEVIRRGKQYISDTITPADLDVKDIPGGWYSGLPEAKPLGWYVESDKLDMMRNKMVLDVGSTVRLADNQVGTIAGLRQDGLVRVVTKSGTNKGKEVLLNPGQVYGSILRNVTAEPEIVGKTLRNGKINFTGNSGLTTKQAYDKLDTPSITRNEVTTGGSIVDDVVNSKSNGLSSLNVPAWTGGNAPNKPISASGGGANTNVPTIGQNAPLSPAAPNTAISSFAFKFRPTWRVANDLESKTGIPVFTKLYRYGREASDNYMHMKLENGDKIDQVFKDAGIFHFSKSNKAAQSRVTELLEKISTADTQTPIPTLASRLNGNVKETRVAVELRKLYDEAAAQGSIDPAMFAQYYSPRRSLPDEPLFEFLKKRTTDYMPFFQHQRTGNLMPREDNALILAHKYFDTFARNKHLTPWYKDIASPMLNNADVIPNDTARNYFTNYMFDVMRYPRQGAVEANDRMFTLVNNTVGKLYGNQQLADDLLKKFGQERMGEVFSDKMLSLQYKTFLGYRPIPALRNATQKLFALPFLSRGHLPLSAEGELLRGWALAKTTAGREKVLASGISGGYQEMSGAGDIAKRLASPMHAYQKIEIGNRASIYLPIHDRVLNAFNEGKKISEVSKNLNLHLYPETIQNEFKRLYTAGAVKDVRQGTTENAAHFLGDWAQLMTQFPYEKGGGPELFRQSPWMRQFGAFQSWSLFTADYLGNMAKDVVQHPIQQRQKLYALGKMYAYYTMLDSLMENALGIDFHSNPQASVPTTALTGSPAASAIEGLTKMTGSFIRELEMDSIEQRNQEYQYLERTRAAGAKALQNVITPGIVRDINKLTGEENIIDSTKKIVGID